MLLELKGVSVRLAGATVLDGVTARLGPGVTLLTGRNGAGKTTLVRLLAGLIPPAAGTVLWRGRLLGQDWPAYRRRLGYLPQRQATYPEMRVAEFLDYLSALKAIPRGLAVRRRDELLEGLGLSVAAREPLASLSEGQRRLVGVGQALLNDPDILLLDEPLESLDFDSRARVLDLIDRPGRATLLATHRLEVAVPTITATWRLDSGKILLDPVNDGPPLLVEA
jgi:ABC-2 type transport system ATP-binding protein